MSSFTYDDAIDLVLGKSTTPPRDSWDDAIDSVLGGPQYVAGGPGGIPGAKDVPGQSLALSPEVQIKQFRALVAGQGGDLSGKSDAEVAMLMHRFNTTGGQEMADYQPEKTRAGEFGRGLRRGVAYGLPLGIPGVEAMRENEQVQRAPEGVAGFAGETLGGFAGMLNPEQAPANALAIALTGGMGRAIAPIVGRVGEIAGPRVARAVQEAIINAGQGGGIAALQEAGRITPQEWAEDPAGSLLRIGKAAGIGAGAGGALGGGIGALGKAPVDYPAGTLPETLAPQTAADGRAAMAEQGQAAMRDVADVYRGAPRANESDPAVLAARNAADAQALAQAEASARAYDAEMMGAADIARRRAAASAAESAKIIENAPEPARVETPETQIGANREEAQGQAQGNQEGLLSKEPPSPDTPAAVDWSTKSYAEIRARAKELGVLDGPKTRAALTERVKAAESNVGGSTPETAAPTPETKTRQPWEMTRDEFSLLTKTRPVRGRQISFVDWASSRGIDTKNLASESDVANFIGQSAFPQARSRAKRGKEESLARRVQQRRVLEAEYEREVPEVDLGTRTIDQNSGSDAAFVRSRHRRAVAIALSEGRAVPAEVLKDYPELAGSVPVPNKTTAPTSAGTVERYGIYEVNVKGRGTMYAVRESDNASGYGDTIHATRDEAAKYAQESKARNDANAVSRAIDESKRAAKERSESEKRIADETTYGVGSFTKDMTPMERGRSEKSLSKQVSVNGIVRPLKEHIAQIVGENPRLEVRQEWKVLDVKRTTWNRMDQRQQDAWEKRRNDSGKHNVYRVNGYDFGKTGHDYAAFLIERSKTPDLAASAKPPTPAEPATTAEGTGAAQAESPRASGESTALEFGNNPNSDKNQYELRRDDRGPYSRSLTGWVLLNKKVKSGEGFTTVRTDIPESALEIAYDTPHTMTDTGYTMKENKILSLMKKTEGQRQDILRRVLAARTSKDKTPVWSDSDGNIQTGEGSYRNRGTKLWEPLNEAARAAKVRIDRQKSASPGRVDTPKDVRGRDIYVYARSNSGQVKPMAGPFYTQHEAEAATREIRNRIDKGFSRVSVIRDFAGFSYGAVDRGSPVDVLYPDIRSPEGSSPFTDYPGTGQGTAPKEGTAGTAAKEAPEQPVPSTPKTSATAEPAVEPPASSPKTSSSGNAPEPTAQSAPESPRPERPASKDRQTSDDFTARRVVNKPEPGEPEGPVTSARNAMMDEDRFALGLDAADGPERRSWQSALDTAVARKIPDDALGIAAEVNAKPRPLDDIETAGLVYKANELKNRHRELMNEIGGTKDESVIRDRAVKAARIEDEFDTLSTALRKAGTEQGRALASRKLTLREDYSLVAIKSRAKAAAGRELTPAENAKFEAMSKSLEDASTKIASLEKELADLKSDSTIKRHAASKRGIPKETREKIIVDLAANVRQLIESGCR